MMTETDVASDEDYDYDSYDEYDERPAERWAPLGAAASTPPISCSQSESSHLSETDRLKHLEEEQDQLNSSLLALTTHFAQVQFRLKQVTAAEPEEKEFLLKELEEFAFKGIPDVRGCKVQDAQLMEELSEQEHDSRLSEQRQKQQELIQQLKSQLEDLETYAYQTGQSELPTSQVIEKQSAVIDQLRSKLDLELEEFEKLSPEDLRKAVDKAIGQIVNPAKVKEKLVDQLKTQITDLERFIEFLQGEAQSPGPLGASYGKKSACENCEKKKKSPLKRSRHFEDEAHDKTLRDQTVEIMKRTLTVLQLFAVSQLGCGGREFRKNVLKRTSKGNHWGDLRARLEVALNKVIKLQKESLENDVEDTDYNSDTEDAPPIRCNQELATAVRKELAVALRDLMQHGLMEVGQSTSLVPFGCFPSRRGPRHDDEQTMMHAWDLFVKYYEMKHGREYNETPARKLSQSFSLDIVGGKAITAKQTLLGAIEEVRSQHVPLKRSDDSQFKAFVCLGLNQKRLVTWLRLLLRTTSLIEYYYQPWSYVIKTGFDDTLVSLERLSKLDFKLPVDLAVRPFNNIKDAF